MKLHKEKLNIRTSIFVRYRNGFKLEIEPNIRETIKKLVNDLKVSENYKKTFNDTIKDINDGSGAGVHPDSTWQALVKELFELFHCEGPSEVGKELINVLSKLTIKSVEEIWDSVKTEIIDNVDVLSGWNDYLQPRVQMFQDVIVKPDGKRYIKIGSHEAELIGGKTQREAHFQYIADEVLKNYGKIRSIIQLIALMDVADQFALTPEQFPDKIMYALPDNNHNTWFLHWRTKIGSINEYIPIFWRPRSCYSDQEWLANDLLASFASKEDIYNIEPEFSSPQQDKFAIFQKAFESFPRQYELALETDLYLGKNEEVYFDFLDRKLRWINGTGFSAPLLIVPHNDDNIEDAIGLAKKFISILAKESGMPITEISSVGVAKNYRPTLKAPRAFGGLEIEADYLFSTDPATFSQKEWIGYALYREGISSKSDYFSFLSFYKILELGLNNKTEEVKDWIDKNIKKIVENTDQNWEKEVLKPGQKAGNYLYGTDRNAVAHIEAEKDKTVNPDDLVDLKRVQKDLPIIRSLANEIFKQGLLK